MGRFVVFVLLLVLPAAAQNPLTLRDAVRQALTKHPTFEAAAEQTRAAGARAVQAAGGYLPRVSYSESFQRSNNPVFVFSSLLTQRQFGVENFAIGPLNRPDYLNNFQSMLAVEQMIWDGGATRNHVAAARLGQSVSAEEERRGKLAATLRVVDGYFAATLAEAALDVAREAVRSAEADLERAEAVRQAGMSTDADVLSIRVHVAGVREQEIRRSAELEVARAALNEALALPFDSAHELTTPLEPLSEVPADTALSEKNALEQRPEVRQIRLAAEIADRRSAAARAALLPEIAVRGVFEADRQQFARRGGANGLVAVSLRWNLFDGVSRARIAEAGHAAAAERARIRSAESAVTLEVRRAAAALRAASERIRVASAAVEQAEESLRIVRNRFGSGLTTVTELLRNETALLDTRTRRLAAVYDQRVAAAALELAAGTLTGDSDVLR